MLENILDFFLVSLAALFVIANPITTSFVFNTLTTYKSKQEKLNIAFRSSFISAIILIIFSLIGTFIFSLFGITIAAFKIAGGLILFGIAMGMIKNQSGEHDEKHHTSDSMDSENIAIIPLAIPFISGPGSIATIMLLSTKAQSYLMQLIVILAIIVVTISCYYCMKYSDLLVNLIGNTTKKIIIKIFGLILAVISVQFVLNGIVDYAPLIAQFF